ncbi:unnamed protein product [Protopolystoma xenopodis]|uniref:Protein kinase domain-containing protein n=1 Tax=Protopolystoma xenopodis TaxID=117903 RepID=A0A3S5AT84_9PLAT|nr:unnamed protein product [Protopolystoma xenopodis]
MQMSFLKGIFKKIKAFDDENRKEKSTLDSITRDVNPEIVWENLCELGDGAFGKVYKTKNNNTHLLSALKRVEFSTLDELNDFMIEIDILTKCKHPNIVKLEEVYIYESKLWMYLEFCGGGAADAVMQKLERGFSERQIKFLCKEILQGLAFLHANLFIHRDLKAGNVLFTLANEVKIALSADFGVSARLASEKARRDSFIGTPHWMAPEVIACEYFKDSNYSSKADIWSLGITLIELAEMYPPNHSMNPTRVLMQITKADPPTLSNPKLW